MLMKAVSVKQPWAAFIAAGLKTIETRTWHTQYRGPLLIVASLKPDKVAMNKTVNPEIADAVLPFALFGRALCTCRLVDCHWMSKGDEAAARCPLFFRAVSWVLADVKPLKKPFPVKGRLGFYEVEVPQ